MLRYNMMLGDGMRKGNSAIAACRASGQAGPGMIGRTIRYIFILATLGGLPAWPARAAELVLFESADCAWCQAWHAQIGGIYPKAPEAQVAPLRRVDIHAERPADLAAVRGIIYTPTFVLVEDGVEVGRITGYAGEEFFWGLLGIELKKLADRKPAKTILSGMPRSSRPEQGDHE